MIRRVFLILIYLTALHQDSIRLWVTSTNLLNTTVIMTRKWKYTFTNRVISIWNSLFIYLLRKWLTLLIGT